MYKFWKRRRALVLVLSALASVLMGCGVSSGVGLRADPLPATVAAQCDDPLAIVRSVSEGSVAGDEIRIGRLGDALIDCGAQKQIAVAAYDALRSALLGRLDLTGRPNGARQD